MRRDVDDRTNQEEYVVPVSENLMLVMGDGEGW